MKVTKLHRGEYKVIAPNGREFYVERQSDNKAWNIYNVASDDDYKSWTGCADTLKVCISSIEFWNK